MPAAPVPPSNSNDRPLPLIARADLVMQPVRLRGAEAWVVKDPVTLDYYRLTSQQHAVLALLDGERNLPGLRAALIRQFPDCRPSLAEVRQLAFDLFDKGLAYSTRAGQGDALASRARQRRRKQLATAAQSLLYIRLPGFDPRRLLEIIYPAMRWAMHPSAIAGGLLLICFAWLMLVVRFEQVVHALPEPASFATPQMLLLVWATLGVAKLLHELGHALACKHYGGECNEVGVALLVFSPCLYCDVSDAATFADRRRRLAVGMAGMYVELVLSAIAAIVWWHTEPGMLRNLCLAIFLVTNVSTIAFNLNPLLRLDGYYLLSDWLETPNLRAQASRTLNALLARWVFGIRPTNQPASAVNDTPLARRWLVAYAVASGLYRWMFLALVTFSIYAMLKPYGLGVVGLLLGGAAVVVALVTGCRQLYRFLRAHSEQLSRSNWTRRAAIAVAIGGLCFFLVPLPLSIEAPLELQPSGIEHLYVSTPGRLAKLHIKPGQQVVEGQLLAELHNREKRDKYRALHTALRVEQVELAIHQATGDAAGESTAASSARSLYQQSRDQYRQLEKLRFHAPQAGTVVEPPAKSAAKDDRVRLANWSGRPVDPANRGAYLQRGTHLLSIAPAGPARAIVRVAQHQRQDFCEGAPVRLQLDALPGEVLRGCVEQVTSWTRLPARGKPEPAIDHDYRAIVTFDYPPALATTTADVAGMTGRARVWVTHRTPAEWLWRQIRLTFNARL